MEDYKLDPDRTVRQIKYTSTDPGPYKSTEIFGDEVRSLVTDTCLYRETAYTIFFPSASNLIPHMGEYLQGEENRRLDAVFDPSVAAEELDCPWTYVRRHFIVSNIKIFLYYL